MTRVRRSLRRTAYGAVAAVVALSMTMSGVLADPAADAVARLDELSRQAVQTRSAVTMAQREADARLAVQTAADERHRADLAALQIATAQLEPFQAAVDRLAATAYTSGGTGQFTALLTAASPGQLIDQLSLQRALGDQAAHQMKALGSGRERAAAAAAASEASAADARAAAEQASAVRSALQAKWSELLRQIAAAEAQYATLTPQQQAVVDVGPDPAAGGVDGAQPLPVGVASETGLQANTVVAARAVSAKFPQIAEIDGVRPDSKPWHPSGLAIDVMIPNPSSPEGIALGDAILAFAMSNVGPFGLQDVIWRGTYYTPDGPRGSGYGHYDHVHITTTPRH